MIKLMQYFFINGKIENNELPVTHLPANEMWANMLTKPLQSAKF